MRTRAILLAALGSVALGMGSAAYEPAPQSLPVPTSRPAGAAPQQLAMTTPSPETTGAIPRAPGAGTSIALLKSGLDALKRDDAAKAIAVRNSLPRGSVDRKAMTWAIATSGARGIPSYEIADAEQALAGWPGLSDLRALSEKALARENPSTATILSAFGNTQPETTEGALLLARALVDSGKAKAAAGLVRPIWSTKTLDLAMENRILKEFSGLLTRADHKTRMELLLYRGRTAQAKRFSSLGEAQSLYNAWVAVAAKSSRASALIKAVDGKWQDDPAYLFLRIEYLRKQDKFEQAAALLARMPRERARLVDPSEWWNEQRIISRGLVDEGKFKAAYRIVAGHVAEKATDKAEAEFHAGWYALRGLKDPATAARHFQRILEASNRPISVSRAYYWLGRAAEAGGPGKAAEYFARAARHPGSFYGQLAAARLGKTTLNIAYPSPSAEDRARFQNRETVQVIARLEEAGHGHRAAKLYTALSETMERPGELALLAARAERRGDHHQALQVGKNAYARGIDVAALAYPIGAIPKSANIKGSGTALAYSIARQESAFNVGAVSGANARGLLQILPGTAKIVAKRHGIAYSADRLTTDAAYNATLGAHYLSEQIDTFGGSYIMTFIAYNAGPRRVPEWIGRYGDPRGKSIDEVVDWIERIPFPETRNYVQRVMENYQVYKARLGQKAEIEHDLRFGR